MRSTRRVNLGRGAARKGHQQDPAGIGPVDDQMGNPVGHGVGLPGARAGDDQEGCPWNRVLLPHAMLDGSSLFAIEGLEIGDGHRWQIGLQQVNQSTIFLVLFATPTSLDTP